MSDPTRWCACGHADVDHRRQGCAGILHGGGYLRPTPCPCPAFKEAVVRG